MSFFKRIKDKDAEKKRDKKLNRESSTKVKSPKKEDLPKSHEEVRYLSDGSVGGNLFNIHCL